MFKQGKKVFVGMSGGVDSSVAAMLLKNQGYDTVGVFMRCFNVDGCAEQDAEDARRVAEHLGIPFYVWNFEEEYKQRVVDYMVEGYRAGLTPNPDVMCNREIKFGLFLERALKLGADFVATGHYVSLGHPARTGVAPTPAVGARLPLAPTAPSKVGDQAHRNSESFSQSDLAQFGLFEAKDKNKDQSYFLWTLTADKLRHCLFPIGDYLKTEVRALAREAGLPTADKKDSQGICFLGQVTLEDFLKTYLPARTGEILTVAGQKIGEHQGAHFYTIGQRHGLDLRSKNQELGIKGKTETKAHYVASKDVSTNTVVVAEGKGNAALYRKEVELTGVNLINQQHPYILENVRMSVWARVRYRQPLSRAVLTVVNDFNVLNEKNERTEVRDKTVIINRTFKLIFDKPQKFVAAGQSAVFYLPAVASAKEGGLDNLEVLGGGVIV